jgi:hypothetical protein
MIEIHGILMKVADMKIQELKDFYQAYQDVYAVFRSRIDMEPLLMTRVRDNRERLRKETFEKGYKASLLSLSSFLNPINIKRRRMSRSPGVISSMPILERHTPRSPFVLWIVCLSSFQRKLLAGDDRRSCGRL